MFSPFCFRFLLPKMNFGSSVLHGFVEPPTDCCRYVGVVDTIEQLLMVNIVECSCQNDRDKYCSVSHIFSREAGSNVGGHRQQCSAFRVLRSNAMVSWLERDVCPYLGQQVLFQQFSRMAQYSNGAPVLADVDVLAGFQDMDDNSFVPYSRYPSS